MQKLFFTIALSFLILSCDNQTPKEESVTDSNQQTSKVIKSTKEGRKNFAVIWKWTTSKTDLVSHHLPAISKELSNLWEKDIIENAYFDSEAKSDKLGHFANVAFFLKAKSLEEARAVLNDLTVVKEGIATYVLHPVGLLWLNRKTDLINKKGLTNSYAAIWETSNKKPTDPTLEAQSKKIMELWNTGKIENVYFDIEGIQKENAKTDFVFFVNADTKEAAEAICNGLPFFKEKIATYELFQAEVFWMGRYEDY